MQLKLVTPHHTVGNAFLQQPIERNDFKRFRGQLFKLLNYVDEAVEAGESEEHIKGFIKPFLNNTNFGENYFINTKERQDLAIHNGETSDSSVGVIIETKRPSNREMITAGNCNRKAFHESILYYLRERLEHHNEDIKHIIITDGYQWFIFDAHDFERHFYSSKKLKDWYNKWNLGQKVSSRTQFVYDHLSEFIAELDVTIQATYVDINKYRKLLAKNELTRDEQKKLVPLFKLFTPTHLLKLPFAADSNNLNKGFYRELLYLMGLKEYKKKGTHYITRRDKKNRQPASLIENTITQLKSLNVLQRLPDKDEFGDSKDEQLFNAAIQLLITWINRILFLKLLEAQLYKYHRKDEKFRLLSYRKITEYDGLQRLFFQVLAVPFSERSDRINKHYGHIPYLNSSLFDVSKIEQDTIRIAELEDGLTMPVYSKSKIRRKGERLKGESLSTLEYLLQFLDSYNFNTEGTAEIQEEAKTLINASVLGRIFEKINGYSDGSFFTPGYITEYMCRETIRRAVVQKFKEVLAPSSPPPPQTPLPHTGEGLPSPAGGRRTEDEGKQDEGDKHEGKRGMSSEIPGSKLPEELLKKARYLRKNQTEAEELLWQLLRNRQLANKKFRRQHPIREGFILDFYCHAEKLAVEVDGGYHKSENQQKADAERTGELNQMGIRIIRFTNKQVLEETEKVLKEIRDALVSSPHPQPRSFSLEGEGCPTGQDEGEKVEDGQDEGGFTFTDIYNAIGRDISIQEANEIINSMTICDPAVGSGHFLVSALNELIAIKSDLRILADDNNELLRDVEISVDNDELNVAFGTEPFFEYQVKHDWLENGSIKRSVGPDTQRLQKTLFREKNTLIENCLFGVDINPNSVNICRLRLWIELLKNAYYREETDFQALEVLPNIDINIKQGNSLISRFDLDTDVGKALKHSKWTIDSYRLAIDTYQNAENKKQKREMEKLIADIKSDFRIEISRNDPKVKKLRKLSGELAKMTQQQNLFKMTKKEKTAWDKKVEKLTKKTKKLEQEIEEIKSNKIYKNAFEWRFEFPEVLNEDGDFIGFDVVIGNPPYGVDFSKALNQHLKAKFETNTWRGESYVAFAELSLGLLKEFGQLTYIIPDTLLNLGFTDSLRKYLLKKTRLNEVVLLPASVFESATVDTIILHTEKRFKHQNQPDEKINVKFYSKDQSIESVYKPFKEFSISLKSWQQIGGFNVYSTEEEIELILKLDSHNGFDQIASAYSGIKGYEVGKGTPPQTKEIRRNKPYTSEDKMGDNWSPFYDGKHIGRYENYWKSDNWIKYGEWLAAPRKSEIFEGEKILARKIVSDRLIATYIPKKSYCNTLLFVIKIQDEKYPYKFLLAILNSLIIGWYYRKKFQINPADTFPQILIRDINQLPIPDFDQKISSKIVSYVEQILTAKKENPQTDTSKLEAEIDQLVYELYGLNEEEIAIVEGN